MSQENKNILAMGSVDTPLYIYKEDRFGYGAYIKAFSCLLSTCETPMAISVQGDWGVGKTSFVHMVMNKLTSKKDITEEDITAVEFNTWKYSKFNMDDKLAVLFLEEIVDKVVTNTTEKEKAKEITIKVLSSLTQIFNSVQKKVTGVDIEEVRNSWIEKEINLIKELDKLKQILEESAKDRKIIVFIDDLDRLAPKKAIDLLEILQIFLTIKNFVFILAVDYEVVVQGFEEKMGSSYSKMKSKNFFDKIIQLSFSIPKLDADGSDEYIKDLMKKSIVSQKIREDSDKTKKLENLSVEFKGIILNSVQFNPRKLKRVMNNFWLLQMVMANRDSANNSIEDLDDTNVLFLLFYVLCMQLEYEPVYHYFLKNVSHIDRLEEFINYLVDIDYLVDDNEEKELDKEIKGIIEQVAKEDENLIDRLGKFAKFLKDKLEEIELLGKPANKSENDKKDFKGKLKTKKRYLESVLKLSRTISSDTIENKRNLTRDEALNKFKSDARENDVILEKGKNMGRYINFYIKLKDSNMKLDFKSSKNYLEDETKYSGWHALPQTELDALDENSYVVFCLVYSLERIEYLLISKCELEKLLENKPKGSNNKFHFYFKDDGDGKLYEGRDGRDGMDKYLIDWKELRNNRE